MQEQPFETGHSFTIFGGGGGEAVSKTGLTVFYSNRRRSLTSSLLEQNAYSDGILSISFILSSLPAEHIPVKGGTKSIVSKDEPGM